MDTPVPAQNSQRRIVALDVARGIAILGTLATNIWIFAYSTDTSTRSILDLVFGDSASFTLAGELSQAVSGADVSAAMEATFNAVVHLVTDGKFLGLLTIMFGIGMEIQRQSSVRKGKRWPGGYYWRAMLLVIEGLINYIFIFEFDVLMGYGLTALAVTPILARSERVQKIAMWIALVAHLFVIFFFDFAMYAMSSLASEEELAEMNDSLQLYESTESYWAMVHTRVTQFADGRFEIPILLLMSIVMFILGARLYRAGLFEPARADLRKKVLLVGLGLGVPLDWTLRLFFTSSTFMTTRYITSAMVAFGILALIAGFYVRRDNQSGVVGRAVGEVGRMALTCYIFQNIIASIIFYDFGLGAARAIEGPWQIYWVSGIYLIICGGLIVFCALWLRRFSRGPVELLMHRLYR